MRCLFLYSLFATLSFCAVAQSYDTSRFDKASDNVAPTSRVEEGKFSTHINEVEDGYNFILYEPQSDIASRWDAASQTDCVLSSDSTPLPLIITLHSRNASGDDLTEVDRFGTIDALHSGMELNAVVLAPEATDDHWDTEKIVKDVNWVIRNRNIDTNRIYAIGMSMGGNGVANLVASYPDKIAAAIILAGTLTEGDVVNLNKVPLWIIRGTDDREKAIERTDRMVNEMRSQADKAPRLVYSKVQGLNHREHQRLLYMPYFYQWLMSHNLENPNRSVNTTIDLTPKFLKDAHKGLSLRKNSAALRKPGNRSKAD